MRLLTAIRDSYGALHILYRLSGLINLFCRQFDRRANILTRQAAALPSAGLLNGQNRLPLADLPYGAWRVGRNGCEVIAVYNALQELNMPMPLAEVMCQLERGGLLFNGFGGTNLGALKPFFRNQGIALRNLRRRAREEYDKAFMTADCAILSYWTGPTLRRADKSWNTLHTVSIHHSAGGIAVCNVSMNGLSPVAAPSIETFLRQEDAAPVCLMILNKIS